MTVLLVLSAALAASSATALCFTRWYARADWSVDVWRRTQAPMAGLGFATAAFSSAGLGMAAFGWVWFGVGAALYVGLPAWRACEWRAAWRMLWNRLRRAT